MQKDAKPSLEERGNIKGYMEAALWLGEITSGELNEAIHEQHQKTFGKNIRQRRADLFDSESEEFHWGYFDKPVWEREKI